VVWFLNTLRVSGSSLGGGEFGGITASLRISIGLFIVVSSSMEASEK
jgi:hypothetical protein